MRAARREDGAAAMMTAILMVVIVGMTSFAVDLGMQRVVRSDMQALADVVALDTARLLDGRTAGQIRSGSGGPMSLDEARKRSVKRNEGGLGTVGEGDVTADLVFIDGGANGQVQPRRQLSGELVPVPNGEVPDGVWVSAAGEVQFAFRPGSGGAQRSAMAQAQSVACFRLGSVTAGLSSAEAEIVNSLLRGALGYNVSGIGYAGLAGAKVNIAGLATELGIGTAEALVAQSDVRIGDLYLAAARALTREGGSAAHVTILQNIAAKVSSTLQVRSMADLFALSTGGAAGLAGRIDALDLVMASALAASADYGAKFDVTWNVPKVSQGTVDLAVVEPPRLACGPAGAATATTAQLRLLTTLGYSPGAKVGTFNVKDNEKGIDLNITVDLGRADGSLTRIRCGIPSGDSPDEIGVSVTRTPADVRLDATLGLTGKLGTSSLTSAARLNLVSVLGLSGLLELVSWLVGAEIVFDLDINIGAQAVSSPASGVVEVSNPAVPYTNIGSTGGAPVALPVPVVDASDVSGSLQLVKGGTKVSLSLSDVDLGPILTAVKNDVIDFSLAKLVKNVNDVLVTPVSRILGLSLTSADVFALERPACGVPALVR